MGNIRIWELSVTILETSDESIEEHVHHEKSHHS